MNSVIYYNLKEFFERSNAEIFEETEFYKIVSNLPSISYDGPWLAGGSIRRLLSNKTLDSDFDYFFKDADQMKIFEEELKLKGFILKNESSNQKTYSGKIEGSIFPEIKVQLIIIKYYDNQFALLDSFDYTISQFLYDGSLLAVGDCSLWDLARNKLVINEITYPASTIRRLIKYSNQGFTACDGCIKTIVKEIAQKPKLADIDITYID